MGARYAKPNVSPWMNTDSKSTDIPYRPSKARSIARYTTLLMIAYERAGGHGTRRRGERGALLRLFILNDGNLQCFNVMFNIF